MAVEELSLADWYLGWTIAFAIAFSVLLFFHGPNDLANITQKLVAAGGLSIVCAAWFALPMWAVAQLAS